MYTVLLYFLVTLVLRTFDEWLLFYFHFPDISDKHTSFGKGGGLEHAMIVFGFGN